MLFLVAIHRPHGFDHAANLGPEVRAAIDAVNDEMVAAGVRRFVGGLMDPASATSLDRSDSGSITSSEGAFLQASHYVDGVWILDCTDQAEATDWGRKAAAACGGSVEVRAFAGAKFD
jgi:hypothetical protein